MTFSVVFVNPIIAFSSCECAHCLCKCNTKKPLPLRRMAPNDIRILHRVPIRRRIKHFPENGPLSLQQLGSDNGGLAVYNHNSSSVAHLQQDF